MDLDTLIQWRKRERERLVRERIALNHATVEQWRQRIDDTIERGFPRLAHSCVALCWPIRNEYDARHLAAKLRAQGAATALPVVVAQGLPMIFRAWHPGTRMAEGPLGIPYPADSAELTPQTLLLPMNGWDAQGYRLGYGGGYFDRTIAAMTRKPLVIGVAYEQARMDTIRPQPWDVPVDFVVTEKCLYRRSGDGLVPSDAA